MSTINSIKNSGYFTFQVGTLQVFVFTDGASVMENIQPMFAPNINLSDINDFLSQHFLSPGKLTLAGNVLIIKTEDKTILIDAGCGQKLGPNSGKLLGNLISTGIEPEKITDIVLTHAHPDHIGGIVNADNSLAFPNAKIYLSKKEYDFWTAEKPDFSKGTQDAVADFEIQFAKHHLSIIDSDMQFYEDNAELFGFLKLENAPGHTPGHTIITIASQGEELVHIADTFQHIILVEHPEWGNQIDSDFELGIKTRIDLLEKLASTKQLLFGDHLPFPGLGFIEKNEKGYRYIPKAFYTV
ncbi:MBL fold metallo-hydrolase [Mariniflexile gromovii]|uniref:MBL fold metallo-hydrolase n=1 Tax=Mariniflexile gromovii TaxID=362523 RepID=A0ABS4BW92_9FLAO|nr:MBL fold metallo-hydrolase [Mariniflexile gromovii]MBP0904271.1 MBL fold metallo-hydrolase [Mariniflexile gromovii]